MKLSDIADGHPLIFIMINKLRAQGNSIIWDGFGQLTGISLDAKDGIFRLEFDAGTYEDHRWVTRARLEAMDLVQDDKYPKLWTLTNE